MIRRLALALVLCLFVATTLAAAAAGAGGKWQGQIDTPDGPITVVYNFILNGEEVTGTATGPEGDLALDNGRIDGDILTFTLTLNDGALILHEATVAEDHMAMIIRGPWGEVNFNLNRVKEE